MGARADGRSMIDDPVGPGVTGMTGSPQTQSLIDRAGLDALLRVLRDDGYETVGPVVRDGAIVYDRIDRSADLPEGWTDRQEPGSYRLERRSDGALFGYNVGPHSWKRLLFPPRQRLWQLSHREGGFERLDRPEPAPRFAFIGVRACELAAIGVQDRVFTSRAFRDPIYAERREGAFVVAVNCGRAGGTCFCDSMGTGPRAAAGFDLALTELLDGGRHAFLVEVGTAPGAAVMERVPHAPADERDIRLADEAIESARRAMGRALDTEGLPDLLKRNLEHPAWDEVAERCLACANCTMVCPTCFCSSFEDTSDLSGDIAERWRQWDSCFNGDFSRVHGGRVRDSTSSRYRQWLTHKLSTWHDQFGSSGCVGCGRCIAWCPVGIDLTAEARAIRERDGELGRLPREGPSP